MEATPAQQPWPHRTLQRLVKLDPWRVALDACLTRGAGRRCTVAAVRKRKMRKPMRWVHTLPVSLCRRNREARDLRKLAGGRYLRLGTGRFINGLAGNQTCLPRRRDA